MKKFFKKHRLSDKKKKKTGKVSWKKLILIGVVTFCILIAIPLISVARTPFGSFIPHATKFFNFSALVLLQNEAELRPGGGFISAVGFLEIRGGKPEIYILDSYAIEEPPGQMKAPEVIETYFSKDPNYRGWMFRDTNFFADFPQSAENAVKFLKFDSRFTDKNFDAVIAVNFSAVEEIVTFLLEDEKLETSLFKTLQNSTKNVDLHNFEQWESRKSGIGDIAQNLVKKVTMWNADEVLDILAKSADEKEIQMYFFDDDLQALAQEKEWTGALPHGDFFGTNISNLGAKKSNRFMQQQQFSTVSVDADGDVKEHFTLRISHGGTHNLLSDPGYYLVQIFRPVGTKIQRTEQNWSQESKENAEVFSTTLYISPGEMHELSAIFSLSSAWSEKEEKKFTWVKQAGTNDQLFFTFQGRGDQSFMANGCDEEKSRENVFFCHVLLDTDRQIIATLQPDTIAPFLENAYFDGNDTELFIRFSEAVIPKFPVQNLSFSCDGKEYLVDRILGGFDDPRDARVVLKTTPGFTGGFCDLRWKGVMDPFGNTEEIRWTVPAREEL